MKIRVTIQSFGFYNNGNSIFISAWRRFLDRKSSELDRFDFVFVNNNIDTEYFTNIVNPYPVIDLQKRKPIPFDTEANFIGISSGMDLDYDYLMRVDHDAFPSADSLNAIADFLENNTDVTFVSASNFPRSIFHHIDGQLPLDCSGVGQEGKRNWDWLPWKYPTNNGDLFLFKRDFFKECLESYNSNTIIQNGRGKDSSPFHSEVMRWNNICRTLDSDPFDLPNIHIRIDGGLRSDFWTIMCASPNMKMAGIVNHDGRSFCMRNHVVTQHNDAANSFDTSLDVVDTIDVSWKHDLTIAAPYWHLGNGYMVEGYFDPGAREFKPNMDHFKPHFTAEHYGTYVAHWAMVKELAAFAAKDLFLEMHNQFTATLTQWGVDYDKIQAYRWKTVDFYKEEIKDYL